MSFVKLDRNIAGAISDKHISFTDKTLLQCSISCSENKSPDSQRVSLCAGFAYSSQRQSCVLTDKSPHLLISDNPVEVDNLIISPSKAGDFRGDHEESGLYQKVCLRGKELV